MFDWNVAYAPNYLCKEGILTTVEEIKNSGYEIIPAKVPGNIELDMMAAGKLEDVYYSTNTLKVQELENLHMWYFTTIEMETTDFLLHFDGIDTIADIYVNGVLEKSVDNMFLEYDIYPDWKKGENEIVVHIKPVCIEARKYRIPASSNAPKYNGGSLYVRKAAHMYAWDIMPRIISAGIWKDVSIRPILKDRIREVYFVTNKIDLQNKKAAMRFFIDVDADADFMKDYTYTVEGVCGESKFSFSEQLWHTQQQRFFSVENAKVWWPKNAGEQNLYDTKISLYYKGELCDTYTLKVGIRTIELERTDVTDTNASGEFCFCVNGKKIFVLGSNWVPLDALHSNDRNRLEQALNLVDDIGCNMLRCWGGNVYESDRFFEICDEKGILIWQDFAMGCAVYPQEETFAKMLEKEAVYQIKRLRNHACLALWAGDNEGDLCYMEWARFMRDPNKNILTRRVLAQAVETHDYSRNYLPSSPYVSQSAFDIKLSSKGLAQDILPEDHLWGPRDYFKGEYYKKTFCHFASETGYHGFPSPKSLQKFLKNPEKIFNEDGHPTDEYLAHATSAELDVNSDYAYRIRLAHNQVVTLFGSASDELAEFARQSQISQAEAKKYFIERFRVAKWKRTGIIWWNLLDGWPQVSDAVVDYYFTKKLAYHYIKRSQEPVCLMFDEPQDNILSLMGVNDFGEDAVVSYKVTDVLAGEQVLSGSTHICADSAQKIGQMKIKEGEKVFYLIEWDYKGRKYKNHYFTNIIDIDYNSYMKALKQCGMNDFEGF